MGDGDGNMQVTKRARPRVARVMVTAMRVVGDIEGEGGKAMATATRVAGKRAATATKSMMAMKRRGQGRGQWQGRHEQW